MPNQIAWGFLGMEDLFSRRVSEVTNGYQLVRDAIVNSTREYSRQANEVLSALAERTTDYKIAYAAAGRGTLQPLDEWGNPQPRKPTGKYDVAFPIRGAGDAWGNNRISRVQMTVQEANDMTLQAQSADADWLMRHALAALLSNTSWTFADVKYGNLTIMPLANNDAQAFVLRNGKSVSNHNHYKAQAAAISDAANGFAQDVADLEEHPENGSGVAFYVPSNLVPSVQGLTEFQAVNDPNLTRGANFDRLTSDGEAGLKFGDKVLGYLKSSRAWVVEWARLPDNYYLGLPLDGSRALRMREFPEPALQGLFPEFHSPDGNVEVNRVIRFAGFGVANRVGALVRRIGNASYVTPADFVAPLAV